MAKTSLLTRTAVARLPGVS